MASYSSIGGLGKMSVSLDEIF